MELERRDIFDPDERGWVARLGTRCTSETRPPTIRRELLFHPGELYDSAEVAESERNLRALGIFRRVRIDSVRTDSGLVPRVLTKDGWSTQIDYRFRSAGGQVEFTIGLVENNLLGTASLRGGAIPEDPDRSTVALAFRRPRLFAGRIGLGAQYEDRSDGRVAALLLEQPFFALTSRNAFSLRGRTTTSGSSASSTASGLRGDTLTRRYTLGARRGGLGARAPRAGVPPARGVRPRCGATTFIPEGASAPVRQDGDGGRRTLPGLEPGQISSSPGAMPALPGKKMWISAPRCGSASWLAPKAFGYERTGSRRCSAPGSAPRIPLGFAYLEALAGGLYTPAGLDSGSVQLAATAVLQPTRHQVGDPARRGWLDQESAAGLRSSTSGWGRGPAPSGATPSPATARSSRTAEYRLTVVDDFLGMVGLGVAGFVDHGGAWYAGSPRRTGWDAGVGLRLGASRSPTPKRYGSTWPGGSPTTREGGVGGDRREGIRLLATRQTAAIIRAPSTRSPMTTPPARPAAAAGRSSSPCSSIPFVLFSLYLGLMLSWSYSDGDRAGVLQKFSRRGWFCKTYEGELAMTTAPGVAPIIWDFSARDPQSSFRSSGRRSESGSSSTTPSTAAFPPRASARPPTSPTASRSSRSSLAQPETPIAVILNPAAGHGGGGGIAARVTECFAARSRTVKVTPLGDGISVGDTVRDAVASGAPAVVAAGGDGTINAVASALVGSDTPLGVLPVGTLNHFAKDLGLPLGLEEAVAVIVVGKAVAVDVGEVNGRIFLNNSSLGVYPRIVELRPVDSGKGRAQVGRRGVGGCPGTAALSVAQCADRVCGREGGAADAVRVRGKQRIHDGGAPGRLAREPDRRPPGGVRHEGGRPAQPHASGLAGADPRGGADPRARSHRGD